MASVRKITSSYTVNEQENVSHCPILSSLYFIGGRWKINILWNLHNGINRFGLMKASITGISDKMLTTQLRELEADEFISREVFAEVPLRVEYTLTTLGQSLIPILSDLSQWGLDNDFPKKYANKMLEDLK
jgi:DNA-binding HxlR family transcriptional regulator